MSEEKTKKEVKPDKAQRERDEYLEGWKRAKADLANYKKDELVRLEEVARFSNAQLLRDIISVLDSFELAITSMEKVGGVDKGVYLIRGQLTDVLRKYGLEVMEVKEGDEFDPAVHDAVTNVESEEAKDGMVAEEVERGYLLHGKVIRPAKVKVYKKK